MFNAKKSLSATIGIAAYFAFACSNAISGEEKEPKPALATVLALGDVQSQTILAKARLNLKTVQDHLVDEKPQAEVVTAAAAAPAPAPKIQEVTATALPNVRSIINDEARFIFAGGSQASGRVGSVLPGGFTVTAIEFADRTVTVRDRAKKSYTLSMSSNVPVAPAPASDSSATQSMNNPMRPAVMPPAFMPSAFPMVNPSMPVVSR